MPVSYSKPALSPSEPSPKPLLRGWLHLGMTPLIQLAGVALMVATPTLLGRLGIAVYVTSASILFGMSALYHRGTWSDKAGRVLRRFDHANIFLFIAGTYTPLALLILSGNDRAILLGLIWGVAAAGIAFNLAWPKAPRWLYTALYVLMGWAAVGWLPQFWTVGGPLVVGLILGGGLAYTAGAVVYARKRPDPSPTVFGFHEIFHACTILAALCHFAAIALIALG